MSWNHFVAEKSQVPQVVTTTFIYFKRHNKIVKLLCCNNTCNNTGEHQATLQDICAEAGVTDEYTAPHTPQLNGVVERYFVTDWTRANAMLEASQLHHWVKQRLWAKAVNTATKIDNLSCNVNNITPYESQL
jgi:hypothetical protein